MLDAFIRGFIDFFSAVRRSVTPPENTYPGALLDTRTAEQQQRDYKFSEIVAKAAPVTWQAKRFEDFRRFPVQNQAGSYSCVWQTIRKLMRVLMKVNRGLDLDFSAAFGYRLRSNYPEGGTIADDAWRVARKEGVTLNALMPSDNLSEDAMNALQVEPYQRDAAATFKMPNYVQVDPPDFETIASIIQQTKKGVMLWFFFHNDEWSRREPAVFDPSLSLYARDSRRLAHSVAAVDYGVYNGKKVLFIEDSAHFGGLYERVISEEFFKTRCFYAAYPVNFAFEKDQNGPKPVFTFSAPLAFGNTNPQVAKLQDVLKYLGFFPSNAASTGYYGAVTAKAVYDWQTRYEVTSAEEIERLQGRVFGAKSIAKMNAILK